MWKISTQKINFSLVWNLPVSCFWSSPGGVGGGVQQAALPGQGALHYIYMYIEGGVNKLHCQGTSRGATRLGAMGARLPLPD